MRDEIRHLMRHHDAAVCDALVAVDGWWGLASRQRKHEMSEAHNHGRMAPRESNDYRRLSIAMLKWPSQ